MVSCTQSGCSAAPLTGKSHCLAHHKEQSTYAYGLDHEIAQKFASKWDSSKAQQVADWLAGLANAPKGTISSSTDFQNYIKSGVILCNAVNALWPNSIPASAISKSSMAFPQRENIVKYMEAAKKNGLRETDAFVTDDLYEGRNLVVVLDSIIALGQVAKDKGVKAQLLSVSSVSAPAPIDINAEVKAQAAASRGVTSPAVPPTQSQPVLANQPKFCGECGAQRAAAGTKFCGDCGKPFY